MKKILFSIAVLLMVITACDNESAMPLFTAPPSGIEIVFIECHSGDADCSPDGAVFNCIDDKWEAVDLCNPSMGYECTTDVARCGTDPSKPAACCAKMF